MWYLLQQQCQPIVVVVVVIWNLGSCTARSCWVLGSAELTILLIYSENMGSYFSKCSQSLRVSSASPDNSASCSSLGRKPLHLDIRLCCRFGFRGPRGRGRSGLWAGGAVGLDGGVAVSSTCVSSTCGGGGGGGGQGHDYRDRWRPTDDGAQRLSATNA